MSSSSYLGTPHATTWSIEHILRLAQEGKLLVPVFQRSFRWDRMDVLKLFDSLYRGFPIGNLLVWKTGPTPGTSATFGPLAFEKDTAENLLIIDGQQRIVSLVATLLRDKDERTDDQLFSIFFDLDFEQFTTLDETAAPPAHWLPMTEVSDTVRYLEWLQSTPLAPHQVRRANELVRTLRDYRVPVYQVDGGPERGELIREIFHRINSTGKSLKGTDIFNAMFATKKYRGLIEVTEDLRSEHFGELDEKWLMKAIAAIQGLANSSQLLDYFSWHNEAEQTISLRNAEIVLRSTIDFLRKDACVLNWALLPYRFPIGPICAYFNKFPDPPENARKLLRQWLWRGALSGEHRINNIPRVRTTLAIVDGAKTPREASQRLLDQTQAPAWPFKSQAHRRNAAATRIACCVLAKLNPRHLQTNEPLDLEEILARDQPFPQLVKQTQSGTESRILHPSLKKRTAHSFELWVRLLNECSSDTRRSHLITPKALQYLNDGKQQDFIKQRRKDLDERINKFLREMCGTTR